MTKTEDVKDYANEGLEIRAAMLDHAKRYPDARTRPDYILWDGAEVRTMASLNTPKSGVLQLSFRSAPTRPLSGVDLKMDTGHIILEAGERVSTLRTWNDERYKSQLQYRFENPDSTLKVWNVYERVWDSGSTTAEKWTGNAGMIVEKLDSYRYRFSCSSGPPPIPDFNELVFELSFVA